MLITIAAYQCTPISKCLDCSACVVLFGATLLKKLSLCCDLQRSWFGLIHNVQKVERCTVHLQAIGAPVGPYLVLRLEPARLNFAIATALLALFVLMVVPVAEGVRRLRARARLRPTADPLLRQPLLAGSFSRVPPAEEGTPLQKSPVLEQQTPDSSPPVRGGSPFEAAAVQEHRFVFGDARNRSPVGQVLPSFEHSPAFRSLVSTCAWST